MARRGKQLAGISGRGRIDSAAALTIASGESCCSMGPLDGVAGRRIGADGEIANLTRRAVAAPEQPAVQYQRGPQNKAEVEVDEGAATRPAPRASSPSAAG